MAVSRALFVVFGGFLVALAFVGCASSASWATVQVAPSYQPPRSVTLKVSASPAGGEVTTLEMALVDEFAKRDIHATPLDDENSRPALRVVIEKWEPGSKTSRGLLSMFQLGGLAEGEIVVRVEALSEQGQPAIQGTVQGWVDNTTEAALRAIADRIASVVATGAVTSEASAQARHTGYP